MTDPFLRFLSHPCAVIAHVFCQSCRPFPRRGPLTTSCSFWVDWRLIGELGWNFDHRLVDQHGYRVEIRGVGLQSESLRLQRNGSPARKGIMKRGQFRGVEQLASLRMVLVQLANLTP